MDARVLVCKREKGIEKLNISVRIVYALSDFFGGICQT